jgi:cysteine desulfurase
MAMAPRKVYLDNSATTQVDSKVLEAMLPYFNVKYGNPNSLHEWGRDARVAVDSAREKVAWLIGAQPKDIIFTGGGSEADNLAVKGLIWSQKDKSKKHIITSAIEHHAMLNTIKWVCKLMGFDYTILPVDSHGFVDPKTLEAAIRPDTLLASVMFGNNEIGTVEPIEELGEVCHKHGVLFHTDAVQAAGHVKIDVSKLPIDMMTMAAHKMYGPKGVGALYVRKGLKLTPLVHGGGQEFGLRSGTENTPGIVGFGEAAALAAERLSNGEVENEARLRDKLLDGLVERIPEIIVTGDRVKRLPYNASICVKYIEGEGMLLLMDAAGIAVSSGSACTSGSLEPSHVLLAIGLPAATAHGSVRMTISKDVTDEDIDYVLETFPPIVERLRSMSPFYKKK